MFSYTYALSCFDSAMFGLLCFCRLEPELPLCEGDSLFPGIELSIQLGLLHFGQYFPDDRTGIVAYAQNVVAGNELGRPDDLGRSVLDKFSYEVVGFQMPIAGKAVQAMQSEVLIEPRQSHKSLKSSRAHALYILKPHVMFHKGKNLVRVVIAKSQ